MKTDAQGIPLLGKPIAFEVHVHDPANPTKFWYLPKFEWTLAFAKHQADLANDPAVVRSIRDGKIVYRNAAMKRYLADRKKK